MDENVCRSVVAGDQAIRWLHGRIEELSITVNGKGDQNSQLSLSLPKQLEHESLHSLQMACAVLAHIHAHVAL